MQVLSSILIKPQHKTKASDRHRLQKPRTFFGHFYLEIPNKSTNPVNYYFCFKIFMPVSRGFILNNSCNSSLYWFDNSPMWGTRVDFRRFFSESPFLFFAETPVSKGIAANKLFTFEVRNSSLFLLYSIPRGNTNC